MAVAIILCAAGRPYATHPAPNRIFMKKQRMTKQIWALALACVASFQLMAQARYTSAEYQKAMRPAVATEIPFAEKTVADAIENKMGKMGYKGKGTKGYTLYSGVKMAELGPESYDLYYMVDRVSRKDKGNSTVTLLISKGFDNFVSDSADAALIGNAKNYLNGLRDMVAAYDLELQITEQEELIKKADKKYNGLVDDGADLQKKKRKIEDQITENTAAQAAQKAETEKQRQILEMLRGKRKQ
jgi:hypothetical protein